MPQPPVVRDPEHPDFPHGTSTGATRGCRCDNCRRALYKFQKVGDYRRATVGIIKVARPEVIERVIAHVTSLLELDDVCLADIGRASGMLGGSVTSILDRTRRPSASSAARLLAVTPGKARQASLYAPIADVRHYAGTMQALGYSIPWQSARSGIGGLRNYVDTAWRSDRVERHVLDRLAALAEEVGTREASDADGLRASSRTYSKRRAEITGYWPPQFYDEDRVLHPEWIPGHPWAEANRSAERGIDIARHLLTAGAGETLERSGELLGLETRTVSRYRRILGLHVGASRLEVVDAARAALAAYDALEVGPLTTAFILGVRSPLAVQLPKDHPEVVAWRAAHPAAPVVVADLDELDVAA